MAESLMTAFDQFGVLTAAIVLGFAGWWGYRLWKGRHDMGETVGSILARWRFWAVYGVALLGIMGPVFSMETPPLGWLGERLYGSALLLVPIGLYFFMDSFGTFRRYQRIANTPTSKVRSMAMGVTELEGTAVPAETVEAPFSGEECLFYTYEVEEGLPDDDSTKDWVLKQEGREAESFYLDDGTGQVLVDPRGAELRMNSDNTVYIDDDGDLPERIKRFMERKNIDRSIHDMRFTETYLAPEEHVYVYGEAMERPSFEGSAQNEENIVVNQDENTPMFLIADTPEEDLKDQMDFTVKFGLFGGAATVIAGVGVLVYYGAIL